MKIAKAHYIYLAIGYDASKACNKLALLYPLLRMQFYIGVRTGLLPDDGYKTSSCNKQWKYLAKVPLAIYSLREVANEDETWLLKYLKERALWNILANKAIGKHYDASGCVRTEETRRKIALGHKGRKKQRRTPDAWKNIGKANKGKIPWNKGTKGHNSMKQKATKLIKTNKRLGKYGAIAIQHKKHGAILLADAQCMLDFCKQTGATLQCLELLFQGKNRSTMGWRLIEYAT